MKEYWVNVYEHDKVISAHWPTRTDAKLASRGMFIKTLYRIHVKMKEPKIKIRYEGEKMYNYVGNKYAIKGQLK